MSGTTGTLYSGIPGTLYAVCAYNYEDGLLCVIDGAKGLHKAIEEVFGRKSRYTTVSVA